MTMDAVSQASVRAPPERAPGVLHRVPKLPLAFVVLAVALALLAPFLGLPDPTAGDVSDRMLPPSILADNGHILGTDRLGRDMLSRLVYGARVSLSVALLGIAITALIGVTIGAVAGMSGGLTESLLMRFADIGLAIPGFLFAIFLAAIFGPSFRNIVVVVVLLLWPQYARVTRSEVIQIKYREYIALARIANVPTWKILVRHVLPNVSPSLLVLATFHVGFVIMIEASLSYLGAGIPPPNPSWGVMISDGQAFIEISWWLAVIPGLAIMGTVLSWNMLGDWLRDVLDPKLRHV
jgi:peptide/nickel transport system permease protein